MNIKENDRLYKTVMASIKVREEMIKQATTEQERQENLKAIDDLLTNARILTSRI